MNPEPRTNPAPRTLNPEPALAWLVWPERALLGFGAATATWCAAAMLEAHYVQYLPVSVTHVLPGDSGNRFRGSASRWAPPLGTVVARLDAPSVRLSTAVLEGSDDSILARGAGHIEDTAFPGQRGNIAIAGHRDTIFRPVRRLHVGDVIDLSTADRVYRYRITRTLIVEPDEVDVLDPTRQPTLTLVTCYPFDFIGHAPKRYVVQATLVDDPQGRKPERQSGSR